DLVAGANLSLPANGDVKTRPAAFEESLDHVVRLKSHAKLVAGEPGLRDDHDRRPDGEPVAKMDKVFGQAGSGEVFAENSQGQFSAGQFFLPVVVVFDRIAVNGLVLSSVDA